MKPVINDDLWSVFTIEDTREVILECIRTSRALAELKGLMRAGSMHRAMSDYILLEEARASSAIEGVEAEFRDVFKAFVTTEKDFGPAVREAIREADAIRECVGVAPSVKMLERICSTIRGSRTQMRRSGQDHSEVVNGRAVYSAPHGENVPAL
ncbi:MAG: hypothetical protein MJZ38_07865, partial [archaeon]|nr:hypothetical protein [archaeon]